MLVQVTDTDVFCPLDSAFVGLQFSGNDVHEGRFSFAVGSDQADVFTFEETERHVVENRTVAETVGEMFYGYDAHSAVSPFCICPLHL